VEKWTRRFHAVGFVEVDARSQFCGSLVEVNVIRDVSTQSVLWEWTHAVTFVEVLWK
jgi:hypothetical protein